MRFSPEHSTSCSGQRSQRQFTRFVLHDTRFCMYDNASTNTAIDSLIAGFHLIVVVCVCVCALQQLSVGDPAASLFGTLYGRKKEMTTTKTKRRTTAVAHNTKSWAGFYGAFLVSFLASFIALYVGDPETPGTTGSSDDDDGVLLVFSKAAFAGIAAAAAEAIDVGWDDNLSLPLLAGLFLQVGSFAFGFQY